jgi:hypothetical protein
VWASTSGCVRASAVDACQNGFRPWWFAGGRRPFCGARPELFDLQAKYADVVSLEATLAYLRTIEAPVTLAA